MFIGALALSLLGGLSACVTSQTDVAGGASAPTPTPTAFPAQQTSEAPSPTPAGEAADPTATPSATPEPDTSPSPSPSPSLTPSPTPEPSPTPDSTAAASTPDAASPNPVPTDTRIVINAPAYRMDIFEDGKLVKSYRIGIGYPEFPLAAGLREANAIIFNPSWTPPNEAWVESPSSQVKIGKKIDAGSPLNPLGFVKIPIGAPALIHGGKSPAQLGGFASHGCVGLTSAQALDFTKRLASIGGVEISDDQIAKYRRTPSATKYVKLPQSIPVELRYDTIVVEDGKLHIYRDVYERGTNTEENLRNALSAYGVPLESLDERERAQVLEALAQMSRNANGVKVPPATTPLTLETVVNPAPSALPPKGSGKAPASHRLTRRIKGEKEKVFEIASLAGKGYLAPVDLDTGKPAPRPSSARKAPAKNQTHGEVKQR
jgi:lipoprotein-anchoring transpeptidase ErfK/SrfK